LSSILVLLFHFHFECDSVSELLELRITLARTACQTRSTSFVKRRRLTVRRWVYSLSCFLYVQTHSS